MTEMKFEISKDKVVVYNCKQQIIQDPQLLLKDSDYTLERIVGPGNIQLEYYTTGTPLKVFTNTHERYKTEESYTEGSRKMTSLYGETNPDYSTYVKLPYTQNDVEYIGLSGTLVPDLDLRNTIELQIKPDDGKLQTEMCGAYTLRRYSNKIEIYKQTVTTIGTDEIDDIPRDRITGWNTDISVDNPIYEQSFENTICPSVIFVELQAGGGCGGYSENGFLGRGGASGAFALVAVNFATIEVKEPTDGSENYQECVLLVGSGSGYTTDTSGNRTYTGVCTEIQLTNSEGKYFGVLCTGGVYGSSCTDTEQQNDDKVIGRAYITWAKDMSSTETRYEIGNPEATLNTGPITIIAAMNGVPGEGGGNQITETSEYTVTFPDKQTILEYDKKTCNTTAHWGNSGGPSRLANGGYASETTSDEKRHGTLGAGGKSLYEKAYGGNGGAGRIRLWFAKTT